MTSYTVRFSIYLQLLPHEYIQDALNLLATDLQLTDNIIGA